MAVHDVEDDPQPRGTGALNRRVERGERRLIERAAGGLHEIPVEDEPHGGEALGADLRVALGRPRPPRLALPHRDDVHADERRPAGPPGSRTGASASRAAARAQWRRRGCAGRRAPPPRARWPPPQAARQGRRWSLRWRGGRAPTIQRTSEARRPSSCLRTVSTDEFRAAAPVSMARTRSEGDHMSLPEVVSRDEWLAARKALLAKEKDAHPPPRRAERRAPPAADGRDREGLPLRGPGRRGEPARPVRGPPPAHRRPLHVRPELGRRLPELLRRRGRDVATACSSTCTPATRRSRTSPARRSTKIERYKAKKGWTFPWYSSYGSDFNYDFHVTLDESVAPLEYNYRTQAEHEAAGTALRRRASRSRCRA